MGHNKDRQQGFAGVRSSELTTQNKGLSAKIITGIIILLILGGIGYLALPKKTDDAKVDTQEEQADVTTTEEGKTDLVETAAMQLTSTGSTSNGNGEPEYTGTYAGGYTGASVRVADLANPDLFDFANETVRGCDVVVMAKKNITPTPKILNAALSTLFTETFDYGFTPGNFIATQKDLAFESAVINGGVASVYLTGKVGPIAGVCDVPRIETQITETALQFGTVSSVNIFLNGEPLNVE